MVRYTYTTISINRKNNKKCLMYVSVGESLLLFTGLKSQNSTLKNLISMDSNPWHAEGSSVKEQGSTDSNPWRFEGSSSNNSQDSKPDQPFARSQLGTVKKLATGPVKNGMSYVIVPIDR